MKSQKHKYTFTPQIDSTLQDIYSKGLGRQSDRAGTPSIKRYAKRLGWPEWRLYERARDLGLRRPKEPKWSDAENGILERNSHYSSYLIQKKLASHGYKRTRLAIETQLRRARLRTDSTYYSERQLQICLGLGSCNPISNWIRRGLLYARDKGTSRTQEQGGDAKLIHEADVRRFIIANPHLVDLRKVDQVWFFDVMFEGKAGMTVSAALRDEQEQSVEDKEPEGTIFNEVAAIRSLTAQNIN